MEKASTLDPIVQQYGDLVFDLCESILWSPINAQVAFRAILKSIRKGLDSNQYNRYERSWLLKIACSHLRVLSDRHGRKITASQRIELDSNPSLQTRLKNFDYYFHRLQTDDQLLLLLRDKYGIPYSEISSAMGIPEGSIRVMRQQALRALEEWLWNRD